MIERAFDEKYNSPAGRFAPSRDPTEGDRFSGNNFLERVAYVHRIGIHKPGHDLLIRPHVGSQNVHLWTDKRDQLLKVAAREDLELATRKLVRVNPHPSFRAAIGQPRQRAFQLIQTARAADSPMVR